MTNTTTYEFTAFDEQALLDAGSGNGSILGCGDTFTMPASATVCFEVKDNDAFLSGDSKKNENANDHSHQTAHITDAESGNELGNGGQIYAEVYHWVYDQDGNWYVMIEIEQEGTGDDYFTFYNGYGYETPAEGTELTVHSSCNVKGSWVDFKCLDAGIKFEPNPDGKITIEAEDLELSGYKVEHQDAASGNELIKLKCHTGYAKLPDFKGESCVYDIEITVIDENDGEGFLDVFVDGEFVGCFQLTQNNNGNGVHDVSFSTLKLQGVEIPEGAEITFKGRADGYEFIRIDKIDFCKVEFKECDLPDAVKLDFEGFSAGDILTDLDGLTISASGGSGDAMIFDSQNPTGGDSDLETQVTQQGNILIISEDGDSGDPDDAIGGTITFDFDNPAQIFDIKVIDTEEGGTITLTLADGSTVEVEIPRIANGGVAQVLIEQENVVSMDVALNGSGAIDDLCYVPGEPQLGSLSGRYWCDVNRDGLDNDGLAEGICGITVELLDENGMPTGRTTTTSSDAATLGDYSFADLEAGTYGVRFIDQLTGKVLTEQNANGNANDDIDSDAGPVGDPTSGVSEITGIVVTAGNDTPDNDAGVVEQLGSLSGRYFCDDNRDDLDNDGPDNGIGGVIVTLLDANNNPVIVDGNPVTTTTDSATGNYSFTGLVAGTYGVLFSDAVSGKTLVAPNANSNTNDDIDSDAIALQNPGESLISGIVVVGGQDTPDNDAGVENLDPTADDEVGEVCYDETVTIDLIDVNDFDPEGAELNVVAIDGVTISEGETITLDNGVVVTLGAGGEIVVDGENALVDGTATANLLAGQSAVDTFTYMISDGSGGTDTADVTVTYKGATDTLEKIAELLPAQLCFELPDLPQPPTQAEIDELWTVELTTVLGDPDVLGLNGLSIDEGYCVDFDEIFVLGSKVTADVTILADGFVEASQLPAAAFDHFDEINWILNNRDSDLLKDFNDGEIQGAIWGFTNDNPFVFDSFGTVANAEAVQAIAEANGDGFELSFGDTVAVLLDPVENDPSGQTQPFIVGLDGLWEDCIC
ncbi:MAG: SdrD B-like domain-containing protein [Pseudomonadota bacterium]